MQELITAQLGSNELFTVNLDSSYLNKPRIVFRTPNYFTSRAHFNGDTVTSLQDYGEDL